MANKKQDDPFEDPAQPVDLPDTKPSSMPDPAAELLKRKIIADAQRKTDKLRQENEDKVFFLKCPRRDDHVAAWLTEKPSGAAIHPGMWYSLHHKAGEPWSRPHIPCQECFIEGEQRVWSPHVRAIARGDGSVNFVLTADRKFVIGSMTKAQLALRSSSLDVPAEQEVKV